MNNSANQRTLQNEFVEVFLCYSHKDYKIVHALYRHLKRDGVNVWLDKEKLLPGQDWESQVRRAILKSDIVLVCLSRQFNRQGGYRHEELKTALEKANLLASPEEIFIIPVRLEKCLTPKSLRRWQRVDLFEPSGYKKLLNALRRYR